MPYNSITCVYLYFITSVKEVMFLGASIPLSVTLCLQVLQNL